MKMYRWVFLVLGRTLDFHVQGGLLGSWSHRKARKYSPAQGFFKVSPTDVLGPDHPYHGELSRTSLDVWRASVGSTHYKPAVPLPSAVKNKRMSPDIAKYPLGDRIPSVENYRPSLTLEQKISDWRKGRVSASLTQTGFALVPQHPGWDIFTLWHPFSWISYIHPGN